MKWRCETCPTSADCRTAFRGFWDERSHGGVGCDRRFEYDRAFAAAPRGGQKDNEDRNEHRNERQERFL